MYEYLQPLPRLVIKKINRNTGIHLRGTPSVIAVRSLSILLSVFDFSFHRYSSPRRLRVHFKRP